MGDRLDRLQARTEAGNGDPVLFELGVGQVGNVEITDPAESRASELSADIGFSRIGCNQEKWRRQMKILAAQREIK